MIKIDNYEFDENLYYYTGGDGHIWVQKLADGKVKVGFDDFGQKLAGKILFVRTVPEGKERPKGKSLGTIETGKYVGAIKCPLSGMIEQINPDIKDTPALINEDPYNKGWIAIIAPSNLEVEIKEEFIFGEKALREWMKTEIAEHVK
ncbi:MAG: glycine cleavage system protein H [Candidatus Thorarchaeota archaeon]